jgi:hypothetical protein
MASEGRLADGDADHRFTNYQLAPSSASKSG